MAKKNKKVSLEKYLRYAYNSKSTNKLKPIRPLTKFAFNSFDLLQEESEQVALMKFLKMRDEFKKIKYGEVPSFIPSREIFEKQGYFIFIDKSFVKQKDTQSRVPPQMFIIFKGDSGEITLNEKEVISKEEAYNMLDLYDTFRA